MNGSSAVSSFILTTAFAICPGFALAESDNVSPAAALSNTAQTQPAASEDGGQSQGERKTPADSLSPMGVWKTIDDDGKTEKSLVRLHLKDGRLYGRIIKLFLKPHEKPNPRCKECRGASHNKPILGMRIIDGLQRDGDEWSGGTILDPENGKSYRVKLEVKNGGRKLDVRGYIGISLLGRTQTWVRVE